MKTSESPTEKAGAEPAPPSLVADSVSTSSSSSPQTTVSNRKTLQKKPPLSPSNALAGSISSSLSITSNRSSTTHQPQSPPPVNLFGGIIGHIELTGCPCCTPQARDDLQQLRTLGEMPTKVTRASSDSLLTRDLDNDDAESIDSEDEGGLLPRGQTGGGLNYHPKRILVEGVLHKKGSGKDWMGSRFWKPRWARLVMARVEGYEVEVPLLMIYWSAGTATPSNVILLDSTVVFPIDMDDKEKWDAFQFEVRNARKITTNSMINRTFTAAPKKARDAWIYAISQALLMYEKENDKARKAAANMAMRNKLSPLPMLNHRPRSPSYEVWPRERFPSPPPKHPSPQKRQSAASQPTSPTIESGSNNQRQEAPRPDHDKPTKEQVTNVSSHTE